MNTMTYRGYAARVEYRDEDQCFIGHIAGINDVVGCPVNLCFKDADHLRRPPDEPA